MNILAISGSAHEKSGSYYLLKAIQTQFKDGYTFSIADTISQFPLFTPPRLKEGVPEAVQKLKQQLEEADAVIIATPEYTHNIPAVLKNMIEWCTHSGEFENKNVLPITFTPHEPRGEHAMQSLLFSLNTMNAKVVAQLPLYKTEETIEDKKILLSDLSEELIEEALKML